MSVRVSKILFLNQMAGPLFRELAEDLSTRFPGLSVLRTGHPDTLSIGGSTDKLLIESMPAYDRSSYLTRIFSWMKYTVRASIEMFRSDSETALFIVSNPPLLGPAAWLANKLRGLPYIVLVYDLHPDTLINFGVLKETSFAVWLWRKINRSVWNNATAVYTLGPVMAERLSRQFDAARTKKGDVGVLPPWADTEKIKPLPRGENPLNQEWMLQDKVVVLYSGNMGVSHDIDSILQAANLLRDEKKIVFLLIGEGEKWQDAVDFQSKHKLDNLMVLPFQHESRLPYTMSLADISLLALDKGAEGLMIPSKMFYYMAAGSAVIGICSGRNDVAHIIAESRCGGIIEPGNPSGLAEMIKFYASDNEKLNKFKKSARAAAVQKYSRETCMKRLTSEITSLFAVGKNEKL